MSGTVRGMETASTPPPPAPEAAPDHAMTHTTKDLAALFLVGVAGLAQADTGSTLFLQYGVTITGWNPVDDDHDPSNGPFYPEPGVGGFGGYGVDLRWPGHHVSRHAEDQFGVPLFEPGYGYVASDAFIGGYSASSLSFPASSTGSAQTFGTAVSTWAVLPGVTLTLSGNLGSSASFEAGSTSATYDLGLITRQDDSTTTLYDVHGSWTSPGFSEFGDEFSFSFTNRGDAVVYRSFAITSSLSVDAGAVSPVPEPGNWGLMLAGLATLGLLGCAQGRGHAARAPADGRHGAAGGPVAART